EGLGLPAIPYPHGEFSAACDFELDDREAIHEGRRWHQREITGQRCEGRLACRIDADLPRSIGIKVGRLDRENIAARGIADQHADPIELFRNWETASFDKVTRVPHLNLALRIRDGEEEMVVNAEGAVERVGPGFERTELLSHIARGEQRDRVPEVRVAA